jgi:isopenicillin-N N-acyltransferase like protein
MSMIRIGERRGLSPSKTRRDCTYPEGINPSARRIVFALAVLLTLAGSTHAQQPVAVPAKKAIFRYTEGKFEGAELKYYGKIPILVVEGTPDEIGKQLGHLQVGVVTDFQKLLEKYVAFRGWGEIYPYMLRVGGVLTFNFPADHLREFEASVKEAKVDRDLLVLINTAFDVVSVFACSAIVAEPDRSATGDVVFGRNLDLPPFAHLHELTLVTVYRPKGKHAFASVGFPGIVGVISGMNDAGLSLAVNEIYESKDKAPKYSPLGTPKLLLLRRVLEECSTLDEAEKLLKATPRTGLMAVTMADKTGGSVFEITPKNVVRRRPTDGIVTCTNDFLSPELTFERQCARRTQLEKGRESKKLSTDDIGGLLHAARFPQMTMQTMIFEPASLKLHLAFGTIPSSNLPRDTVDLTPLLKPAR